MIPRMGKATVEKIAINAVMAGALPTYMPLLIAGVQLLANPKSDYGIFGVSTGSWASGWIVNGPVRKDIDVNYGIGALNPSRMANAAIGRTLGFVIRNIGGARPGLEDMSTHGNPFKYSLVMSENEEESPWEPMHVQQGLNKEDSAMTLFFPCSYVQVLTYGSDAKGILETAAYNIPPARGGQTVFLVNPTQAKVLADAGWTKKEIQRYIKEYARCTADKHWYRTIGKHPLEGQTGLIPFNDTDSMPLIVDIEHVRIVVSGKYSSHIALVMGPVGTWQSYTTQKIEFPANWPQLVKKYKNIVPKYARY